MCYPAIDRLPATLLVYPDMAETAILVFEITLFALALNLPFGYLRAPTKKFSFWWFLYIHLPIPAIFVLRRMAGLGYEVVPIIIAGAVVGQVIGARLNRKAQLEKKMRPNIEN
jgi:hypothetical protein